MNDQELDRLIAQANPFGADTVRQLPVAGAESDLLKDIMTASTSVAPTAPTPLPQRPKRRRGILAAAAAAAIVAGIGISGALFPDGNPAAPPAAYAAEVVAVAEANPRLLLDKPGWKVIAIGQFTKEAGELQIGNGNESLTVHWRPAKEYAGFTTGHSKDTTEQPIELLGQSGKLFVTKGVKVAYSSYSTVLPVRGVNFLDITAVGGSEQAYRSLLAALKPVDVNTWLDALPASAIRATDTGRVVDEMLADIKVPARFDPAQLKRSGLSDRNELGAKVTGAVSCSWIKEWEKAKSAGDTAGVRDAVTAMQSSRSWKVLLEMKNSRWPDDIWATADTMATGKALSPEIRAGYCK
ncbi:hypothetical protein [Kribbella sp. CA-293567]|uniref:hypothetical protein n=1 Tax=Kribbella sp. CA-293567 TaxID=3002436 RepID=UPI0022DD336F|nr:hypothetical protein [Kribbella sp. CA-293567]WBQ08481.1 hypothetical protein OX958_17095 [Kribbella sp. CA-293567]